MGFIYLRNGLYILSNGDVDMNTETLMKILITLDGMDEDELIARLLGDEPVGTIDRDLAYEYQMNRVIEVDE